MTKWALSQGCQDSSISTNQSMIDLQHISKLKNKSNMIISIDAQNAFDKIQHLLMIKNSPESRNRRNIPQCNKSYIWQTHSKHYLQWWKVKAFALKSGTRQGCPLSPLLFNTVLEVLATAIRAEKEIKGIQIAKEVKHSLFAEDMILYISSV